MLQGSNNTPTIKNPRIHKPVTYSVMHFENADERANLLGVWERSIDERCFPNSSL